MSPVFLDTGYLIALEAGADQHHPRALAHWRSFSRSLPPLLTTSFVFAEVVTFFNGRGHHAKAVEIGTRLLESSSIRLVQVDQDLLRSAWDYFGARPDKRFSLTDCVSFVLMERMGVQDALSFDSHFVQAGFHALP